MSILFVTHDIDESVYLGERVIVLSKSPTWVQEDLAIDLSCRPRPDHDSGAAPLHRTAHACVRADPARQARRGRSPGAVTDPETTEKGRGMRSRQPKQLLLAFFGEYVVDQNVPPLRDERPDRGARRSGHRRAGDPCHARSHGAARPAQPRAPRREILFSLTGRGKRGAPRGDRARARPASFRTARHRLDARHLHRARGAAHPTASPALGPDLGGLRAAARRAVARPRRGRPRCGAGAAARDLPVGAITAFHARELPGYAMADSVRRRLGHRPHPRAHLAFIETWSDPRRGCRGRQPARRAHDARRRLAGAAGGRTPDCRGRSWTTTGRATARSRSIGVRNGLEEAAAEQFAHPTAANSPPRRDSRRCTVTARTASAAPPCEPSPTRCAAARR